MVLSFEQVKERIKNPVNRQAIEDARFHESRIQLHTKAVDKREKASSYLANFLRWVEKGVGLPSDKMNVFKEILQFPAATTALCNTIFDEYEKIFTAQDQYFDVDLLDDSLKAEFKQYLKTLNLESFFRTDVFEAYKSQPAVIYTIDLPAIQLGVRPQPYINEVSIADVVDIVIERNIDRTERIGYLIYKVGSNQFVVLDDATYRLVQKTNNTESEYLLLIESPHPLGYTPATFLVHTPLYRPDDKSPAARKVIMSSSMGDFDWLLFWKTAERMFESYGPFPIFTVPETRCDYTDGLGNHCSGGYVAFVGDRGQPSHYDCPVCKKNNLVGPGSIFTAPVPRSKEDPVLDEPVKITGAAVESLEYITKKTDLLEQKLYEDNVGSSDETVTKEAVNEKQVQNTVEGKRNILCRVKRDFEQTKKFLVDTMGRLMFADYYVGCTVNYGEQFLLYTADEVALQYDTTKKIGLPSHMINQKKHLLIQTENKNNPSELQRAQLLDLLEPWPDRSPDECLKFQFNIIFPEKFLLKLDFAKFVSKFELANGDIVMWGSALSQEAKIDRLTKILFDYATAEHKSAKPLPKPEGSFQP